MAGYKLPVNPGLRQGTVAQGFVTPKQDRMPQVQNIPPKRVLPIIFIPGIMGSNLRMTSNRQAQMGAKNNIAWRPDNLAVTVAQHNDSSVERQLRLDPETTELDSYDPVGNPTGDSDETSDERNSGVDVSFMHGGLDSGEGPLLKSDTLGTQTPKTRDQKARERGWGEVYFGSYRKILASCEIRLNSAFAGGRMDPYLKRFVAGVAPSSWQAHSGPVLKELDENTVREAVKGCWFPVHAMGYNWLQGNADSGARVAKRITALINGYQEQGFQCEKVILVTHSMGGLVARALIHPEIGNLNDKVLGVVHGVMPAIGAGTAYKRVRCGFEGDDIGAKILGHLGSLVTPVLGNSQGGLELLPNQEYGNHWLQVKQSGRTLKSLPENGDPYEEIYKVRGKWYGLLREKWINPARLIGPGFKSTCLLLDRAREFHNAIAGTYHGQSFAHYGADSKRVAWHRVVWEVDPAAKIQNVDLLTIASDDAKGRMRAVDPTVHSNAGSPFGIKLLDAAEPGDQTVPLHSADAQFQSGKFKGIFRQTGYEHQASYSDAAVLAATFYSLFRIASTMRWSK